MSLAMPYPARRRAKAQQQSSPASSSTGLPVQTPPGGALAADQVWHVGLSMPGMFPFREASCPCAKAACGLVIPDPDVECRVHTSSARFLQVHSAADCDVPRTGWRRKRRHQHP
jgi:hypothetical protein